MLGSLRSHVTSAINCDSTIKHTYRMYMIAMRTKLTSFLSRNLAFSFCLREKLLSEKFQDAENYFVCDELGPCLSAYKKVERTKQSALRSFASNLENTEEEWRSMTVKNSGEEFKNRLRFSNSRKHFLLCFVSIAWMFHAKKKDFFGKTTFSSNIASRNAFLRITKKHPLGSVVAGQ